MIKTVPEKEIRGDEILDCLTLLQEKGLKVRGIVCDDHASNVSAFKRLVNAYYGTLLVTFKYNGQKCYLFFDAVHLIKNIRHNLLNRKRFLFPPFTFENLYDSLHVPGGKISWKLFHQAFEKDLHLQANMKAAPKLSAKVLHPGNCKQSVPEAFRLRLHPSTSASIKHYFLEKTDSAEFLNLFHVWWAISNSKSQFNSSYHLGNSAVLGDNKPQFLRALADWVEIWDVDKIRNAENFILSAQISYALRRTLRCQASLIEDLLREGYNFVLGNCQISK